MKERTLPETETTEIPVNPQAMNALCVWFAQEYTPLRRSLEQHVHQAESRIVNLPAEQQNEAQQAIQEAKHRLMRVDQLLVRLQQAAAVTIMKQPHDWWFAITDGKPHSLPAGEIVVNGNEIKEIMATLKHILSQNLTGLAFHLSSTVPTHQEMALGNLVSDDVVKIRKIYDKVYPSHMDVQQVAISVDSQQHIAITASGKKPY